MARVGLGRANCVSFSGEELGPSGWGSGQEGTWDWALCAGRGGVGPRPPGPGFDKPEVSPRRLEKPGGQPQACASRQTICPSPAPGTHSQHQPHLLQLKGRVSFLSWRLHLPWGAEGIPGISLGWAHALSIRLSIWARWRMGVWAGGKAWLRSLASRTGGGVWNGYLA